jgi:hypothetical protein
MGKNGSKAEFDFNQVTRGWRKRMGKAQRRATEINVEIKDITQRAKELPENLDLERRALELWRELDDVVMEQESLICEVLVRVPRDWLARNAPKDLDWSNPDSLDWVQESRYVEILGAALNRVEDEAKN